MTFANGAGAYGEYFGIYPVGSPGSPQWQWSGGGTSARAAVPGGTLTWPLPGTAQPPGDYVIKWRSPAGDLLAVSSTLTLMP